MGRFVMYAVLVTLAAFVLSTYVLLEHGGESIAAVEAASIHDLSTQPERFANHEVSVQGRMRHNAELDQFEVLDESPGGANFALVVRSYHTEDRLPALDGKSVRITGKVGFNSEVGIYIDADTIANLEAEE